MANKDLRIYSHNSKRRFWWYEEPQGISIVVPSIGQETRIIDITWKSIRKALARKDK